MNEIFNEQLGRIVRYSYPGFLSLFFLAYIDRQDFQNLLETAGVTLTSVFALVFGAAIYVGYRLVIGELLLFPAVNALHTVLAGSGLFASGVTGWLAKEFGVPLGRRRAAYGYLRFRCHSESEIRVVDYVHTELHILYITAVVASFVAFYFQFSSKPNSGTWHLFGGVILLAAIIADIHAHIRERIYFEAVITPNKVRELLQQGGFVCS